MLSRAEQENTQPDIANRPAFQFYSQIKSILSKADDIVKRRPMASMFGDAYVDARKKLMMLNDELARTYTMIVREESDKDQYAVPSILYRKNMQAKEKLKRTREAYEQVVREYESEKANLKSNEEELIRRLMVEQGKSDELDEKEEGYIKHQQSVLQLRKQITKNRQEIAVKLNQQPDVIKRANEAVYAAGVEYEQSNIDMQKHQTRYYAALSEPLMRSIISVYHHFLDFKLEMEFQYGARPQNAYVVKFASQLSFIKDRLDELMQQLWCPDLYHQFAVTLYKNRSGVDEIQALSLNL